MIKDINKGNTLLVKGPARITVLEGIIAVFGKKYLPEKKSSSVSPINNGGFLIIPGAQSYPLYAVEKSKLDIYTTIEENLEVIQENSISPKWIEIKDSIIKELNQNIRKPLKIIVLGISSGKTS
ncbi:MAG: hypothetical protein ACFFDH_09955, partial [Promethearchaeota archaeon]